MTEPQREPEDVPPLQDPPRTVFQRWMSRLAFSFVLIAAFCVWQGFHVNEQASTVPAQTREVLYFVVAAISGLLAIVGMRERHRSSSLDQ